jgi:arabinofuranosyltransferase
VTRPSTPSKTSLPALDRVDLAVLLTVCVLALAHAFWFSHTAGDAFISFRYVNNWVRGHGLVFNPGERVMGYSNFLWVVLLYPFVLLGVPAQTAARILGALFACGTLTRVYLYARHELAGRLPAVAAVLSLASSGTFALWIFGGLESQLLGFLLTLGVTGAMQVTGETPRERFVWLGVVFGLASITRPEAIAYVAPTAAWLWLRKRNQERFLGVLVFAGVAASFPLVLSLAAWIYYGDPLPNTYYAKSLPLGKEVLARGLSMTRKFVLDYRWVPTGVIVAWLIAKRGSLRASGWLPLAIIITFALFFLRIGGDMLQYHRMWVSVLPMFALLFAEVVAQIRQPELAMMLTVLVVALTLPNSFRGRNIDSLRQGDEFVEGAHLVGQRLAQLPDSTVVAANNVGVISYENHVRILDMLGLTNSHIARAPGKEVGIAGHESHDGTYVLDQKPDIIILGMPRAVTKPNPVWDTGQQGYPSDTDLRRDPRFASEYELRYLNLSDGRWSPVFVREGFEIRGAWKPEPRR